jgi:hypothetical protein
MARNNGRTVYLRSDGRWANKANDSLKASDFHESQDEACAKAKEMLQDAGGGELVVKNAEGVVIHRQAVGIATTAVNAPPPI